MSKFFFDECVPKPIAAALRALGVDVIHLAEHFAQGIRDVDWIPKIKHEGRAVITEDSAIRRRAAERVALRESPVVFFFLDASVPRMGRFKQAGWLLNNWEAIEAAAGTARAGDRFAVNINGKVKRLERR